MIVSATQSIDSYFGAKVAHPTLGILYNNYMQSFRLVDDGSPYVLATREMPLSSMSATIVLKNNESKLVLGSPGSARIISAVAQITSHWIDIDTGIEAAVSAYRVHAIPDMQAYVEGESISAALLLGLAEHGFDLKRPAYGVSDSHYDPYFGGVHALAYENSVWTGAADPRRDGTVAIATVERVTSNSLALEEN
jgi:gamma-glutamyltranspeptidase/glutathione hydrolase